MQHWYAKLAAEPLVHFLAIGLVLFVAAEALREPPEDPRLIRIDAGVQRHISELFEQDRGRKPTPDEMDEAVELFIRNETLYREARMLRLDDGDEMMRERLAQRMRLMLYSGISVGDPTEDQMREWFAEHGDEFETPATMTLEIIGLDTSEDAARQIAEQARARAGTDAPVGSPEFRLVSFAKRPLHQLQRLFGTEFMDRIGALEQDTWTAIDSPRGWQVARWLETTEAIPARFEDVVEDIRSEWREARKQEEAREALAALMSSYPVEREPYLADYLLDPGAGEPSGAAGQ